ncbi:MAG: hypothetical protein OEY56_13440 [Cyclobacteriaceae bacterium]|nr:hypothetical protein [Cyclobacteriaceae bacterium]
MSNSKPRVIKDFEKLDTALQEQVKLAYPYGFHENLIHFYDKDGKKISALPFETDDRYYMLRMTIAKAKQIIEDDEDFGDDGTLKEDVRDDYEDKYGDMNHMADYLSSDSDDDGGGDDD